ncbi:MAG: ligase-associated DNA damage response exonuclease [Burkholderiaceae bacterium]
MDDLVVLRPEGLFCPAGGFFIDPWRAVDRAVLTHAHADHARSGHGHVLCSARGLPVFQARLGSQTSFQSLGYGARLRVGDVWLSLHPAGHVLGASQVRIEKDGRVWVVSGDYRVAADPSCDAFVPVAADVFITETTFGLPIYRWQPQQAVVDEILLWWQQEADRGHACLVYTYALGKAQRLIMAIDDRVGIRSGPGPVYVHTAVARINAAYRAAGVGVPADQTPPARLAAGDLVLAPQSVQGSHWLGRQQVPVSQANVSGWMTVRGARRRQPGVRGFVLSDHADWPGLLWAIDQSQASRVILTHGQTAFMARWLSAQGVQADTLQTEFDAQAADV